MHIIRDYVSNNLPAKKFFYFIRECQIDSYQSINKKGCSLNEQPFHDEY
jgi:hypothetical protein